MLDWYVTTRASPGNVFRLCICHWRWVLGIPFEAHFFPASATQIFIYSTPTSLAYRHSHGALLVQNTLCSYSTYSRCVCTYASLAGWMAVHNHVLMARVIHSFVSPWILCSFSLKYKLKLFRKMEKQAAPFLPTTIKQRRGDLYIMQECQVF